MNLAVVLVSEQTVPNILFLKDFEGKWDKILLVSTNKMEENKKSTVISNFFHDKPSDKIIVDENNVSQIVQEFETYFQNNSFDTVLANITGGNKLMSIAAFGFFKNHDNAVIYYLPIGSKKYLLLKSDYSYDQHPTSYKLSIEEYFKATGNTTTIRNIENEQLLSKLSCSIFKKFQEEYETILKITEKFRGYRSSKKRKEFTNTPEFNELKEDLKTRIGLSGDDLNWFDFSKRDPYDFFSGGWFEIYTYSKIKALQKADDIACNVILNQKNSENQTDMPSNELDVVFTVDNVLHLVECKTGDVINELNDIIYKTGYLRKEFGLDVKSHLLVLNPLDKQISKEKFTRAKYYNIDLWDFEKIQKGFECMFEKR